MKERPWRILYLIWSLDLGGAEQVVLHLARNLRRDRFSPIVGCLTQKGRFASLAEEAGVPVVCFNKRPKLDWALVPRLQRFLRQERIDLVHSHLFTANLWGRLAACLTRTPIVVTEHSVDQWKRLHHRMLDRGFKWLTTHWVFVSPQVRQFYEQHLGLLRNASVIPNGVPIPTTLPEPSRPAPSLVGAVVTFATVGRLVPEKEQIRFVELVGALHEAGFPVRGLIVGDGPERATLEKAIAKRELSGVVELVGFVSQVDRMWPKVDVFCLTSSREGCPLSLLEAMGHGIPVLATAVGGVLECVQDEVEGLLVPFGDWRSLTAKARLLTQLEPFRQRLGMAGRARAQREFTIERMVAAHESLYTDLLARGCETGS